MNARTPTSQRSSASSPSVIGALAAEDTRNSCTQERLSSEVLRLTPSRALKSKSEVSATSNPWNEVIDTRSTDSPM